MTSTFVHRALFLMLIGIVVFSCKEEKTVIPATVPDNPFDTINYGGNPGDDTVDAATFVGLHRYIFSTTCAVPGCHDGAFEPDFRTVQSSYNTLVYHEVEKNDAGNTFTYRVVPGDKTKSWLHYRITTDDQVLGRMPLYDTLSQQEIDRITNWIENGAADPFGNSPTLPTYRPAFFGVLAYLNDTSGIRLDTSRESILDPMKLPKNQQVDIWIGLYDTDASGQIVPASDFTYNKFKLSTHIYDYSGKAEENLIVEPALKPFMAPFPFNPTEKGPYYHHFKINTGDFNIGQRNYFRVLVQDKDHSEPTEIPSDGSPIYLLTYFSFIVE